MPTFIPPGFSQDLTKQFQTEKMPVGWPWRLLSASFFICLIAVLVYLGLAFGYTPFLNSSIEKTKTDIQKLGGTISPEEEAALLRSYSQVANLNRILENHVVSSKVWSWLEQVTGTKVYYSTVDLKTPERKLTLEGFADSFITLGQQLGMFDQDRSVERYILSQSQLSDGAVQFKVVLTLAPSLLR